MKKNSSLEHSSATDKEIISKEKLLHLHEKIVKNSGPNWDSHILSTLTRQSLSRILYWDFLYQKIVDKAGIIIECGVHYGASLAILSNLRGIYEPYNFSRKIIGFDTFEGFKGADQAKDGTLSKDGDYSVVQGWENDLSQILDFHVDNSPLPHVQKSVIIKGDASIEVPRFLDDNPHQIISLMIFDMDIYKPTKDVLKSIIPRLMKGSIMVFDEFNCDAFPGETEAVLDVLKIKELTFKRHPHQPHCAYVVYE
jgi:hypothetical protein